MEALLVFLVPWFRPKEIDEFQMAIRLGFAGVIFGLTAISIIFAWWNAREKNWEENWSGVRRPGGVSKQLDVDHGSVSDISMAVRTRSEALVTAVPSVLIVIGLLGTFVGLGLALTEASSAITAARGASAAALENMNAALVKMMTGLGYKFATSTWGIIGYLILRAWAALNGFEERRLRFSISRMSGALEASRENESSRVKADRDQLLALLSDIRRAVQSTSASNEAISHTSAGTMEALKHFLLGVEQNIRQMSESSTLMSRSATSVEKSAKQLGRSAEALQETVNSFDEGVQTTLADVKGGLTTAITDLKSTTTKSMKQIAEDLKAVTSSLSEMLNSTQAELATTLTAIDSRTAKSSQHIAQSLAGLSTAVNETLKNLDATMTQAREVSEKANLKFDVSVTTIMTLVGATRHMVEDIRNELVKALGQVAGGNTETREVFYLFKENASRNEAATLALVAALNGFQAPSAAVNEGTTPSRSGRVHRRNAAK